MTNLFPFELHQDIWSRFRVYTIKHAFCLPLYMSSGPIVRTPSLALHPPKRSLIIKPHTTLEGSSCGAQRSERVCERLHLSASVSRSLQSSMCTNDLTTSNPCSTFYGPSYVSGMTASRIRGDWGNHWVTSRSVWSFQTSSRSVIREVCNQENKFWNVCVSRSTKTRLDMTKAEPECRSVHSKSSASGRTAHSSQDSHDTQISYTPAM